MKSGIDLVGAGVKVIKEGYDVASPYIQQGVEVVTPAVKEAVKVTSDVAAPVVSKAVPLVQVGGLSSGGVPAAAVLWEGVPLVSLVQLGGGVARWLSSAGRRCPCGVQGHAPGAGRWGGCKSGAGGRGSRVSHGCAPAGGWGCCQVGVGGWAELGAQLLQMD